MDEKIRATINKIRLLASQNDEFKKAMRELFGKNISASVASNTPELSDDIKAIRGALEIRANVSIRYEFINNQRLRDQLIIDNLRMENAALNLTESEDDRFYIFCVNAFYQVENIINYYYHTKYPDVNDLLNIIETYTAMEPNEKFRFHRKTDEKNVGDITLVHKINAICNQLFDGQYNTKWSLGTLRQVRNEGEHRCNIIRKEKDENNNLYKFFKNNTFNSIRILLIKLVTAIKEGINEPAKVIKTEGIISNILGSIAFVVVNGKTEKIPDKLFNKIKNFKKDDKVNVTLSDGIITDIEPI